MFHTKSTSSTSDSLLPWVIVFDRKPFLTCFQYSGVTLVTHLTIGIQLNPAMSNSFISNSIGFPLGLPLFFFSRTRLSRTPCYLDLFLSALSSNKPRLSRTLLRSEETLVNISQEVQSRHLTRCTESWEMYWRVHGNGSKVKLTGLAAANAEGDKLPVFVNFRDQTSTREIWGQPRYLEPPLSRTISRYPWEFEIAGFYCTWSDARYNFGQVDN